MVLALSGLQMKDVLLVTRQSLVLAGPDGRKTRILDLVYGSEPERCNSRLWFWVREMNEKV